MGLLKRNRAKKDKEKERDGSLQFMTVEEALRKNGEKSGKTGKENLASLVHEDCSQLISLKKEEKEHKVEYDAVTSYLSDIQLIERANEVDRLRLNDCAVHISNLEKERRSRTTITDKLPDRVYERMERYSDTIPNELEKLAELERFYSLVNGDMRQLEGERESIKAQTEDAAARVVFLKRLTFIGLILVLFIFCVLFGLGEYYRQDMLLPFLLTGALGTGLVLLIVTGIKNSRAKKKKLELQMNRAITLTNKIKLKYVTTKSSLDYSYGKYGVESAMELKKIWERYVAEKDEQRRLLQNSELLDHFRRELTRALKETGVLDTEVWQHQTEALIDRKEMVEVRHRLNERRQKLREQIDLTVTQRDMINNQLAALSDTSAENAETVHKIMSEYGLNA